MPNALAKATEQRYSPLDANAITRAAGDNTPIGFRGHAALFDRRTWIGPPKWGFWEQVARGAFSKSIGESDVRFLVNHEGLPLARTTNDTLRLSEDSIGLLADADLAPTTEGRDLALLLERGDVSQMSFGFEVVREQWEMLGDDTELRTIVEAKLWDVSAVTFPAYEDTDGGLRMLAFDALAVRMGISTTRRAKVLAGLAHDEPTPEALTILREARNKLSDLLGETAPAPATPSPESGVPAPAETTRGVPLAVHQRRHQLVASRHGLTTS